MKIPIESSTISRSQSEASVGEAKSKLLLGTTTKLDLLFPSLDQVCLNSRLPNFIYYIGAIYFYYQVIFSSFYPFSKYWTEVDAFGSSTVKETLKYLEQIAYFFSIGRGEETTDLLIPTMAVLVVFVVSLIIILVENFSLSAHHKIRKALVYVIRFILDIVSLVIIIPTSSIFGNSIRNLVQTNDKLNWLYLFLSLILYICFLVLNYLSFVILNSSTCISMTPFSSFNHKIPFLLPLITSLIVIFQGILSIFNDWATIIIQIIHLVVSALFLYEIYYIIFHTKVGNVLFIGVCMSTWINDIIFTVIYFICDGKKKDGIFFYIIGFILPLVSLVISIVASSLFVYFKTKRVLKGLSEIEDLLNGDHYTKLFGNENMALMSIQQSFLNVLPIFYNLSAFNFIASTYPSVKSLMILIQYLSYIPGESRQLNNFLKVVSKRRDLNYSQRFLMFQSYRITMLRQSSVSTDANRLLADLKGLSSQCCDNILSFWNSETADVSFLEMIAIENWKINSKWDEGVRDYPNSQKFSDEYCSFLIECQMNLKKALYMKQRSNFIEIGRNFTIDVPFIRLALSVPDFLKKRILDYNGNMRPKLEATHSLKDVSSTQNSVASTSSGNGSSHNNSFSTVGSSMNFDQDQEESLGRQLFRQANLRIEMHRALGNRKSYASNLLLSSGFIILIIGLILNIYCFVYTYQYIDYRSDSSYYIKLASKTSSYIDLAILGSTLKFAYFTDKFPSLSNFSQLSTDDDEISLNTTILFSDLNHDIFKVDDSISDSIIHKYSMISRDFFHVFIQSLGILSSEYNENIYEFGYLLMHNEVPFITCYKGVPMNPALMSIKSLESYIFLIVEMTANKTVGENDWYNSNEMCEIMSNQPIFNRNMIQLLNTLMAHEIEQCEDKDKIINIIHWVLPVVLFLIDFIPVSIFTLLFLKDANKMLKILKSVNPQAKEEAKKPIRRDNTIETSDVTEKKTKSKQWAILVILLFILSLASAVVLYFILSFANKFNSEIKKLARWNLLASTRLASCVESMNYVLNAVLLNDTTLYGIDKKNQVATRNKMIEQATSVLNQLEIANEGFLKGIQGSPPCYGFDDDLDSLNFNSVCEASHEYTDLHNSYRCTSTSTAIGIYLTMMKSILSEINETSGVFENEMIFHSLHLLNRHLFMRLDDTVDRINSITESHCKDFKTQTLIILIVGIVICFILFFIIVYFYIKSVRIYAVGMVLIQRLPPNEFITDKRLMNFVLNRKDSANDSEMSISQSVIYMSCDAIVCTNVTGVVEIINPAVTNTFGYTPDQMLGQHISTIFSNYNLSNNPAPDKEDNNETKAAGDAEKVSNQIALMAKGQSALVFQDHFICMTDDAREMPCGVTILGMSSSGQVNTDENNSKVSDSKVESFVIILRDETQLMQQQREAEAAKAQSENLLYQILPRDIVVRLNSGEKDISFTVQSASIIFTDVVRFSEYASNLPPQEIMGSLSTLFAAFDQSAKNYEMITKIKLIGDIYMAAAGLFSEENTPPKAHAEQILKFGLDCLSELEDVNIKLNANLQLRVGINSGGPLLAGVLGTDKPVFDIIGDPINVAARLQTTDIPGKIQIPQSTYDLIQDGDFNIEERGEVFLKGKGKTIAYLVSPVSNASTARFFTPSTPKT